MAHFVKTGFYAQDIEQTARYAKAISHPARLLILQLLSSQKCCFHGDMALELPIAKSTLSQHLNELKNAGLIKGNITPPTVKYCIDEENWNLAQKLLMSIFKPFALNEDCEL